MPRRIILPSVTNTHALIDTALESIFDEFGKVLAKQHIEGSALFRQRITQLRTEELLGRERLREKKLSLVREGLSTLQKFDRRIG